MHRQLFIAWIQYVAGMVVAGWLLSLIGSYQYMGFAALLLLAWIGWRALAAGKNATPESKAQLLGDLLYPPFLFLLCLIVLAGSLYSTAVLDSLSYRIPRMLMWLQEGKVHFIDNLDPRMNFMTPVWEFACTPLYQLSGLRLLWLGSCISWILFYLAAASFARQLGADAKASRGIALLCASATGFVLQAPSTMNDMWAVAFISISLIFILSFGRDKSFGNLIYSGLALSLAAGTKPHFAVLALPWLLWFFLSPAKPYLCIRRVAVIPCGLLALLCSPLPTFITNHIHYGSYSGPAGEGGFALGAWWLNIIFGTIMMLWHVIQLPINPFAAPLQDLNTSWIESTGLHDLMPRFRLTARELLLVDAASIGLVCALVLSVGAVIAFRNRKILPRWPALGAIAGIFGFLVAISQVVPGTLGRSFLGFTVLLMPFCICGLLRLPEKYLRTAIALAFLSGIGSLVLSPSHPLWPANTVTSHVPALRSKLAPYLTFQTRAHAGKKIMDELPEPVPEIGVLANGDQNLVHLWKSHGKPVSVRLFPASVTARELHAEGPEYLMLVGVRENPSPGDYSILMHTLMNDQNYLTVAKDRFTSKLERGPEPWILIRRR